MVSIFYWHVQKYIFEKVSDCPVLWHGLLSGLMIALLYVRTVKHLCKDVIEFIFIINSLHILANISNMHIHMYSIYMCVLCIRRRHWLKFSSYCKCMIKDFNRHSIKHRLDLAKVLVIERSNFTHIYVYTCIILNICMYVEIYWYNMLFVPVCGNFSLDHIFISLFVACHMHEAACFNFGDKVWIRRSW